MKHQSNEKLCSLAQHGDTEARSLLLEKNLGFIRKTATEIYQSLGLHHTDLGVDRDDLEQEGGMGLLNAISQYDPNKGIKFLTYAAPAVRNAMTDLLRTAFSQFESRMTNHEDGLAFQKILLDEVVSGEEQMLRIEAIADPVTKTPEQIYSEAETMRELYAALRHLSDREQTYLLYRYGFTDDTDHTFVGAALHFRLGASRAKKLEEQALDNLWLELPWWY